jgi:hypothetical protein
MVFLDWLSETMRRSSVVRVICECHKRAQQGSFYHPMTNDRIQLVYYHEKHTN